MAGYCVVNDVSERAYQPERGGTWNKGQGCDSVGPVGPWLVTADEVPDPQTLDLCLDLNGQPMQRGNIRTMVFGVAALVSSVSRYMTLYPGDRLRLGMQGLGAQRQTVRARDRALSDDLAGTPT